MADVDPERAAFVAEKIGAKNLLPSALLDEDLDVFCPCANGGVLTERRASSKDDGEGMVFANFDK